MKMSKLLAALLFAFSASAFAADSTDSSKPGAPTQPTTGQGAATTVGTTPASDKSGGHADKGLDTAQKNITADHGKDSGKAKGKEKNTANKGQTEKAEKAAKPEHPAKPERPAR